MENITDTVFRQMLIKTSRPDVFFTEFVNVDGMFSPGFEKVRQRLIFSVIEKPIVAQIWGNKPENFYKAALDIVKMGFSGVDINLGCAQKDVMKYNCGSALIGQEKLVEEIIQSVIEGTNSTIPVSVKTRLGVKSIITENWIGFLLQQNLQAITLHGRMAHDTYLIPAKWEEIGKAVKLRDQMKKTTVIIGNGDVKNFGEIQEKYRQYQVDGAAIARAVLSDPWCFMKLPKHQNIFLKERLKLLHQHVKLFEETWGKNKPYVLTKKFIKMYIWGFPKAQELRQNLMQENTYSEFFTTIHKLTQNLPQKA